MRDIFFENVDKYYKNENVLEDFSLKIPAGTFFALLGPSGSGKTTVLKLIAGLEIADKGKIFFGKDNVTNIAANKRKVNTVFQNYALFPHLNVYENISYGLEIRNEKKIEIRRRVDKIAESFNISKYLYKEIWELSGGQQQRVAVARAAINNPEILLLDEPLSALDVRLREHMLKELSEFQDKLNMTFVYVTHDQFEALAVADYMAIMNDDGKIEQIGTPKEIYEFPVSKFVAKFIGNTNIIDGVIKEIDGSIYFCVHDVGNFKIDIKNINKIELNKECSISIRPEKLTIKKENEISKNENIGNNEIYGRVIGKVYFGHATEYIVLTKFGNLKILDFFDNKKVPENIEYDDFVYVFWNMNDAVLLLK